MFRVTLLVVTLLLMGGRCAAEASPGGDEPADSSALGHCVGGAAMGVAPPEWRLQLRGARLDAVDLWDIREHKETCSIVL